MLTDNERDMLERLVEGARSDSEISLLADVVLRLASEIQFLRISLRKHESQECHTTK